MTYPASPNDAGSPRIRIDSGRFWAGAVATTVVAALIALVGILICRWTLGIPILAPVGAGAWGDAHTGMFVFGAAVVALVAAALLYLLMLGTQQPGLFFAWIMGLATLAAVVYPFSTSAPVNQKGRRRSSTWCSASRSRRCSPASPPVRSAAPVRRPRRPVRSGNGVNTNTNPRSPSTFRRHVLPATGNKSFLIPNGRLASLLVPAPPG